MIGTQALIFLMQAWRDRRGQDLIEYALMAGFVAVAAGAIMPGVSSSISTIFSQVGFRDDRRQRANRQKLRPSEPISVRTSRKVARTITV